MLKGNMDDHYGSWMHDASSNNDIIPDKLWVTRHNETSYIYEYKSKEYFKNNSVANQIKLPQPFQVGNLRITDIYIIRIIYNKNTIDEMLLITVNAIPEEFSVAAK